MVRLQTAITLTMPMASSFFLNGGLRSLIIGILCSGAAVQGSPPVGADGAELRSIEELCGGHVNSSNCNTSPNCKALGAFAGAGGAFEG